MSHGDEALELDIWAKAEPERHAFLAIEAAGEQYGFPLSSVREILMKPTISEVPRCPEAVLGVISVRGEITTVVQMARLLKLAGSDDARPDRVLLVDSGDELIGVGVDSVAQVYRLAPSEIEYSSHMTANLSEYVVGVARVGPPSDPSDSILILIDPMMLLASAQ